MGAGVPTVGIDLVHSHDTGSFRIARLWSRGPAAECGQLFQGDTLLCVEGVSVTGLPMHVVQSILDGPPGSVTVIAQRAGGAVVVVSLTRRALDPEDGAPASAGGQAGREGRADDDLSASTDSLYVLDGPMESHDFDDDRFLPGYTEPLAPSTCESIGDDVPASVAGSSQDGPPTQHTDTRAHAARQHGDEKYEHGQEGLDSEDDSFHADLLAQSVILAKCEQLQEALDEAVHQKQQLEERLSRAEDLCQEHAIRCLEAEETIARLQEALDAGRSTNLQQQEQITALEHEVQILELTLRRRKEEEEEEGPPAQPTREAEGTQNQLREWVSLYRSEAARCEELQIKLRLLQLQSADNDRSRGHDTAGGSGGEGSDKESEEVWKPLGEEQNGYGDHGAQVLNSLIQLAATLGNCSLHEKRGRILNQMDHFLRSEDTSTSVLAILALGALGMGRGWETNSTSDHITEMMASRCPSAVGRATALLKTGGSRSRRYSALLLCTLSQSSTGRNRIEQHRPCLPTIIKALADKDIFAATYAVQTVWCLVNHAGTHIWCNRASFGPSQVAAALHAAAHRPGVDPAITEKALAAVHLLQ